MFALITRPACRRVVTSVRYASQKSSPPTSRPKQVEEQPAETLPEQPVEPPIPTLTPATLPSLDFSPPEPAGEPQSTGARSSKDTLSSTERKRRVMGRVTLAMLTVAFGVNVAYMGREWGEEELKNKKIRIEDAPSTRWGRTRDRFTDLLDYFNKPSWPELLPPPLPPPHQKPYTLLLSIDDLLVTSTWDRQHGWRTAKRPGVDYFLAYISQFYELVIFTTQNNYTAIPVLEKLDRYNFFINYKLFRESTRSINGKIVKDLSYLNRDLSKVVLLDTDPDHVSTHPENSIVIPKWKGDPKDRGLVAMIPFLESIAIYKPADVRPILVAYQGKDIPIEYAKKEAEAKQKHIEEWTNKNKRPSGLNLSSLVGGTSSKSTIPPTYLEQKRKEAQHQYKEEQAYILKNKDELERLLAMDQQAMAGEVPSNLWEVIDQLKGNPPNKKETSKSDPANPAAGSSSGTSLKVGTA